MDFTVHLVLIFLVSFLNGISCLQKEFTIVITPGGRDCFYENALADQMVDLEYQVIDGSHGDLDISFELADSSGRLIFADYKKSDNIHRYKLTHDTELTFCFSNEFSRVNSKTVFFEIIIEKEDEDAGWSNFDILEGLSPEEFYDMKVQDVQDIIKRVRNNLTKARQFQDVLRSHEARDRNVAEENYFKSRLKFNIGPPPSPVRYATEYENRGKPSIAGTSLTLIGDDKIINLIEFALSGRSDGGMFQPVLSFD